MKIYIILALHIINNFLSIFLPLLFLVSCDTNSAFLVHF